MAHQQHACRWGRCRCIRTLGSSAIEEHVILIFLSHRSDFAVSPWKKESGTAPGRHAEGNLPLGRKASQMSLLSSLHTFTCHPWSCRAHSGVFGSTGSTTTTGSLKSWLPAQLQHPGLRQATPIYVPLLPPEKREQQLTQRAVTYLNKKRAAYLNGTSIHPTSAMPEPAPGPATLVLCLSGCDPPASGWRD